MALTILLLLCWGAKASWFMDKLANVAARAAGFDGSDTCGFTREDALECIKQYVDANKDEEITCEEFERAKTLYMPPRMRAALWIAKKFGYNVHFDMLLYGCDRSPQDCVLTESDFKLSTKTCLPFPADLCKLKTACDVAKVSTEVYTEAEAEAARKTCAPFTKAVCHALEKQWDEDDKKAAVKKAYEEHMKNMRS